MNYDIKFKIDFRRNPHKGTYIVLEGIDGAGKTVQAEKIAKHFKKKGMEVLSIAEPRRTGAIGHVIDEFLQKKIRLPAASLQYLFVADRIAHQEEIITPALKKGQMVISHRNFWSSIPYGIADASKKKVDYKRGEVLMVAQSILSMYYQIMVPDVTVYLDVSVKEALKRLHTSGVSKEYYEEKEKFLVIKKGYEWLIKRFPKEFAVVDGNQSIDRVTEDIIDAMDDLKK
jgi:dTMP kinase